MEQKRVRNGLNALRNLRSEAMARATAEKDTRRTTPKVSINYPEFYFRPASEKEKQESID